MTIFFLLTILGGVLLGLGIGLLAGHRWATREAEPRIVKWRVLTHASYPLKWR